MADQEDVNRADMGRAETVAKRAMELAARAEELARQAHEVAGVDEQLAALEAELDALAAEESSMDAGISDGRAEPEDEGPDDQWGNWAEAFGERMEALGYRIGDLVSGGIEAAMHSSYQAGGTGWSRGRSRDEEGPGLSAAERMDAGPLPVRIRSHGGSVEVKGGNGDRVHVSW